VPPLPPPPPPPASNNVTFKGCEKNVYTGCTDVKWTSGDVRSWAACTSASTPGAYVKNVETGEQCTLYQKSYMATCIVNDDGSGCARLQDVTMGYVRAPEGDFACR